MTHDIAGSFSVAESVVARPGFPWWSHNSGRLPQFFSAKGSAPDIDLWRITEMIKIRSISIHVIGCSLFLVLPFLFSPDSGKKRIDEVLSNNHFLKDLVHYILLIAFFYLNYYLLVTRFYLQRKYWLYALLIIGCFFIIAFLPW